MGACLGKSGSKTAVRSITNRNVTIVVVGVDNAGKTTLVNNFLGEPDEFLMPTLGFDNDSFERDGYHVTVYGLGGGPKLRGIWSHYYDQVHGVIFVVDSCDLVRLEAAKKEFLGVWDAERVDGKPILVMANKQDIESALPPGEIAQALGIALVPHSPISIQGCVALWDKTSNDERLQKVDPNVWTGLDWLLTKIGEDYAGLSERVEADSRERKEEEKKKLIAQQKRVEGYKRERAEEEAAKQKTENDSALEATLNTPSSATATTPPTATAAVTAPPATEEMTPSPAQGHEDVPLEIIAAPNKQSPEDDVKTQEEHPNAKKKTQGGEKEGEEEGEGEREREREEDEGAEEEEEEENEEADMPQDTAGGIHPHPDTNPSQAMSKSASHQSINAV